MATKTTERFKKIEKLGEGTYGVVYKCEDLQEGVIVALKRVRLEAEDNGVPSTAIREIALLRTLRHPNIVSLRDIVTDNSKLFLVFECLHQDLKRCLDARVTPFYGPILARLSLQLLLGVQHCHQRRILHRDLKPQNILLTQDYRTVKIADFGLARSIHSDTVVADRSYTAEVITLWYRAPELLLGEHRYSAAVDIWSIACIIAEMATKRPLFPGQSEIDQILKIFRLLGTPQQDQWSYLTALPEYQTCFPKWMPMDIESYLGTVDPCCADLLRKMLIYDPHQRITIEAAIRHPFFDEVRGEFMPLQTPTRCLQPEPSQSISPTMNTPGPLSPGSEGSWDSGCLDPRGPILLPTALNELQIS
eukprot:PhF_6_TR31110/c0_g1_i1/m.45517